MEKINHGHLTKFYCSVITKETVVPGKQSCTFRQVITFLDQSRVLGLHLYCSVKRYKTIQYSSLVLFGRYTHFVLSISCVRALSLFLILKVALPKLCFLLLAYPRGLQFTFAFETQGTFEPEVCVSRLLVFGHDCCFAWSFSHLQRIMIRVDRQ